MTASAELKNAVAGLLGLPAAELGKDIKPHFETYDPLMAEAITERFLDRKESYQMIERLCLGQLTPEQFLARLADVLATHAVNITDELNEQEGA